MEREKDDPRSSSAEIEAFIRTDIWIDLKEELELRLEVAQLGLESAVKHEVMLRLQGAVGELRLLLDLPESLATEVKLIEKRKLEKREKDSART